MAGQEAPDCACAATPVASIAAIAAKSPAVVHLLAGLLANLLLMTFILFNKIFLNELPARCVSRPYCYVTAPDL